MRSRSLPSHTRLPCKVDYFSFSATAILCRDISSNAGVSLDEPLGSRSRRQNSAHPTYLAPSLRSYTLQPEDLGS